MSTTFIEYVSLSHLNSRNIALYERHDGKAIMQIEDLRDGEVMEFKHFKNVGEAEDWYSELPGTGLGKLVNAMNAIKGVE